MGSLTSGAIGIVKMPITVHIRVAKKREISAIHGLPGQVHGCPVQ
jgi:hypothetical protein